MNKDKEIHGVDISKDVFDVFDNQGSNYQYPNTLKGFRDYFYCLNPNSLVVMEATGYYHYLLAQFLFERGMAVSVVNPLSVKRFVQMKLSKVKTDKSDAKAIAEYAKVNDVPLYDGKGRTKLRASNYWP